MKAIFNKISFGFLLCVLWMPGAVAWAQPRVSVHPLITEQGPRGERWNALFMREVAKQNIGMTPEMEVETFLESRQGNCRNELRCLRDLGYATRAHYILVGSMLRTEDIYTVHARVVMVNGVEVKRVSLNVERVSKISEEANAMAVYGKLFGELKLESLPSHPSGVSLEPPEVVIERETEFVPREMVNVPGRGLQPRDEWEAELSQSMTPMRQASYYLMGVAGATAATGGVFALLANRNYRLYKREHGTENPNVVKAETGEKTGNHFRVRVNNQKLGSIVSFSVATAAAASGITLFFISPEHTLKRSKKVQLGLVPTQDGAVLSLQGVFP